VKAAVNTRYGPPEVVRIAEVDRPTAKEHEVLVRVYATTVNRTDCGFLAAEPFFIRLLSGLAKPRVTINGSEFAGVVEAIGPGVTSFEIGDDVFGFNEGRFGAHAEYLSIAEDGPIATMPARLSYEQAAASTEGSHYALTFIRGARIRGGHHVLVYGATGAIGSAAVQFLKGLGATVTAVCDTDHVELVRGLGADRIVDYTAQDFTRDEQTYDVVIDAVGKSSFARCRPLLKPRGIYLSSDLGRLSQNPVLALVTRFFGGKKVLFPIPANHDKAIVTHLREMMESGTFTPVLDRSYPLDRIVEAYRYVESGQKIGNVVVNVVPANKRGAAA